MARNLVLAAVSVALALGAAEAALRAIGPGDDLLYAIDEDLIFAPIPGSAGRYVRFAENGGDVIHTRFNALGLRGPPFDPDADVGKRVVVYGDSFIQASYTRFDDTYAAVLQRTLRARLDQPLVVLNRGVNGYGPDQTLLRLGPDFELLRPDLVVVGLFADNDFGDLIRNNLFRIGPDRRLAANGMTIDQAVRDQYRQRRRDTRFALLRALRDPESVRRDLKILFERRLGVPGLFPHTDIDTAYRTGADVPWIDVWRDRGIAEFRVTVLAGDPVVRLDNIRSDHYDADMTTEPEASATRYKLALMRLVLGEIARLCAERGIGLVFVIIPSPIDACDGYDWQVDTTRYPAYDRRLLTSSLADIAADLRVPALDLFADFASAECNALYFHHGNNHWTERGQAMAAAATAELIARRALLD